MATLVAAAAAVAWFAALGVVVAEALGAAVDTSGKIEVAIPAAGIATAVDPSGSTALWPIVGHETPCPYCDVAGAAFNGAETSIDVLLASLDPDDDPVADLLVAAAERGVAVRVLLDQSSFEPSVTEDNGRAVEFLIAHGVDARLDDPEITTHAKMAIVDRETVIVGSTNWNHYALFEHHQADVRIDDERVAQAFGDFFDRLWADPAAKLPLALDEGTIPTEGPVLLALPDAGQSTLYGSTTVRLLSEARRSVHAVMYRVSIYPQYADSVTSELVNALVDAAARGLDVRILIDDCSFYADSARENLESAIYLYQNGVEVRLDDPSLTTHAKLLVIDGETVILGSTNWNYYSVEQNIEASVALLRMPDVAGPFESYFASLWADGRSIVP